MALCRASVALLLLGLAAMACAQQQKPSGTTPMPIIPTSKATVSDVAKGLTSQPIVFVALIKLKPGTDFNKFIATREAVAAKARQTYKDINVAYIKGALPAKTETLPQGAAKLEYYPVAAIVTAPDAKTYADYNALVAKDPAYVSSGKDVEAVVRTVNLQM